MQTIGLTDFWINRPYISHTNNFSILSDKWCSLNNCTIGNGKAYYYTTLVDKQQLKCIVIDDTFYFDFSANPISYVIKQQMWILKHTKQIEYKIEFVCLWEMFKLPTIEQLNEFAKIKQEVVVPQTIGWTTQTEYNHSVEEMRLSTGLPEELQIHQITLPLSEYIDLMLRMSHSRLTTNAVIHHATVIHNHHHPISQSRQSESPFMSVFEDLTDYVMTEEEMYRDALQVIADTSGLETNEFLPLSTTSLNDYLDWIREITDLPEDEVVDYGTTVYNYHYGTQE